MLKNMAGIGIEGPVETEAPDRLSNFARIAVLLVAAFCWIVGAYWQTAAEIAAIWWRSDTFAHGLVVIPIFAWLVWRQRDALDELVVAPSLLPLLPMAVAGMAWLVGQISGVAAISHLALAGMVVLGLSAVAGREISRVIAVTLAFMLFGVPVGEFLLPILMRYTADFTVAAVRFTGIPVFQEQLHFVLPNGRWSVVEACSGLRYLIASVMVGTLYAYLTYVSTKRRLLFMLVAIAIPVVANWIRAYITVMIGYHFGPEFVQGFIHIIYGWVFFGIVILLMFAVGARWQEAPVAAAKPAAVGASVPGRERWMRIVPLALIVAIFPVAEKLLAGTEQVYPRQLSLPNAAPQWQLRLPVEPDARQYRPTSAGHRAEAYGDYADRSGASVGLYVAYFAGQQQGREMVMYGNRLDGVERGGWRRIDTGEEDLAFGTVVHSAMRRNDRIVDLWSWYQMDDRAVTDGYRAKAMLLMDRLSGRPDASALVTVVVARDGSREDSRRLAERFIASHRSELVGLLDDLADRR